MGDDQQSLNGRSRITSASCIVIMLRRLDKLIDQLWRIMFIGLRDWVHRF